MLPNVKNKNLVTQLITILAAFGILYALYGSVLFQLNQHLFTFQGDGIKNYYTYAYYIQQPDSIEFTGLNYPYGEHFLYTDCSPAVALTVKQIAKFAPGIKPYSIGILNSFLLFSFVLSALFLVKSLLLFRVDPLPAVIASLGIAFLSPQVFRLSGHLALAFSAFIPYTIYFLLAWKKKSKNTATWWLLLGNLLFFYIHAYLGMITVLFQLVVAFFVFLNLSTRKQSILLFAVAVLPLIVFRIFLYLTDLHEFRTTNPYGFFNYLSGITAVLFPPVGIYNFGITIPNLQQNWEGWAYIGVASEIGLISAIIFGRNQIKLFCKDNLFLLSLTIAASVVLLFSFGVPFIWGLENIVDTFSIIKNFRGVGRFAWIFYYLINVFVVVFIWKVLPNYKTVALCFFGLLALFEASKYHLDQARVTEKTSNYFNNPPDYIQYAKQQFDSTKYQAILPLPFYYIGSENFGKPGTAAAYESSMLLSYHLNLPIIGSYLTRTGIQESKNIMQIFSAKSSNKIVLERMNKLPILCFHTSEQLTKNELIIRNEFDSIGNFKYYWFFEGTPNNLTQNAQTNSNLVSALYKNETPQLIYKFKPEHAVECTIGNYELLAGPPEKKYDTSATYLAYVELSNVGNNACQECMPNTFFVEQKVNNTTLWLNQCNPFYSFEVSDSSTVALLEFKPKSHDSAVQLVLVGPQNNRKKYRIYEWGVFKLTKYP